MTQEEELEIRRIILETLEEVLDKENYFSVNREITEVRLLLGIKGVKDRWGID